MGRCGPLSSPESDPEVTLKNLLDPAEPARPARGSAQLSGGEKTTRTRRSSEMWWNLCVTPAGT